MKGKFIFLVLVAVIFAGALLSVVWWNKGGNHDEQIKQNRKSLPPNLQKVTLEIYHDPVTVKNTKGEVTEAKNGIEVKQGDTVITGNDGRAQIVFPNGTVTRLDKNTTVTLKTVELSPQKVLVEVNEGQIWSRIAELLSDEQYKTTSTNVAATVKGTSYGHSLLAGNTDQIITTKGEVEGTCLNNAKEGKISKDHKMIFSCAGDSKNSPTPIEEKDKDEWFKFNNDEDDVLNKRFGPFVYKDNGDVLGIETIASNARKTADAVIDRLTDENSNTDNNSGTSNGNTNPTNTPVPVSPGQPTNTPVPNATNTPAPQVTATPVPKSLGYIKPLPSSTFGGTVTSNGVTKPATDGMPIYAGDLVETSGGTRVQVVMPPNSTTSCPDTPESNTPTCTYTRLDTNTSVQVNSNTTNPNYNADIVVEAGKVWNRIKKLTGQESYDSQTGDDSGLVATVRGTSYGHSVGFEDNLLTDRLYTIEGLVSARCKKNPAQTGEVGPNTRAKFQCNKNDLVDFIQQLASMDQGDIDWVLYNTNIDVPGQLQGNLAPVVTINTPSQDLPNNIGTINLDATVTDDGKPFGGTAMVWTINGLPCVAICEHPFAEKTKVNFPSSGIYVMKLTATDLSLSSSAQITVGVNIIKDNKPPVVNAGADMTITLPNKADLNGSAVDDGVPIKKVLVNWWTLVKGPASVTFNPTAFSAQVTATFSKAGVYTLRLNSFDGDKQTFDDINVTVLPAPTPTPSPTATPTPTNTPTPTPTPSPAAFIDVSGDKKEATIRIENLFSLHSLLYTYSYDSDQGNKGVSGEKDPIENNRYEQMIPFGTCSGGVCVYNTGIGNVILDVILKDASNADVRHLHVESMTTPSPTPTSSPTPTNTPIPSNTPTNTPTPTPAGPQVSGVTMTSNTCIGSACNPTFQVTGSKLSTASTYTIYRGSYSRSGNQISKTDTTLNFIFPLTTKNSGYQVKIHFSGGQDIILPGTFNL